MNAFRMQVVALLVLAAGIGACTNAPPDPLEFPRVRIERRPAEFAPVEWGDSLSWDVVATPGVSGLPVSFFSVERWNDSLNRWEVAQAATDANAQVFVHPYRSLVPEGDDTLGWRYVATDARGQTSEAQQIWLLGGQRRPQVEFELAGGTERLAPGVPLRIVARARSGATGGPVARLTIEADSALTDTTWRVWAESAGPSPTLEVLLDTLTPATPGRWRWRAVAAAEDGNRQERVRNLEIGP